MDLLGRLARELEAPAPQIAQRIHWERRRRREPAAHAVTRIMRTVGPGAVGVDIGAAEGVYSLGMLVVNDGGDVHAFEPNPYEIGILHKIQRWYPRLTIHEVALSDQPGTAEFRIPIVNGERLSGLGSLSGAVTSMSDTIDTFSVPVARLDDELADAPRVDIVKIDVEGHEDSVLAGADAILRRHRPSLLIEMEQRHRGGDPRPMMETLMSEYGLAGFAVFPDGLRPLAQFDLERDQVGLLSGGEDEIIPEGYVNDFLFTRHLAA
jgi:FkbM family methyltransferase